MTFFHGLDSLATGRVLEEDKYELTGDVKARDPSAPIKARMARYKVSTAEIPQVGRFMYATCS